MFAGATSLEYRKLPGGALLCRLRETGSEGRRASEETVDSEGEGLADSGLFCRRCGYCVTNNDERITINGSHTHTFFNPTGMLFELGCFLHAPGCRVDGDANGHFTWFAGYRWRVALCRQCACHLGWRFEKQEVMFFCLILPQLTDSR